MLPGHEQSFDQIVLNRAPMITEDETEPEKGLSTPASLQGSLATINAISARRREGTAGRPLVPGMT
jgi:hypothetical protein